MNTASYCHSELETLVAQHGHLPVESLAPRRVLESPLPPGLPPPLLPFLLCFVFVGWLVGLFVFETGSQVAQAGLKLIT